MFRRLFGGECHKASFKWCLDGDDIVVSLDQAGVPLAFDGWVAARPDASSAINDILAASEASDDEGGKAASVGEDHLRISPPLLAKLDTRTASLLGLPPPTPLALDLRAQGRIDEDDFRLLVRWVRPGGQPIRFRMQGAILQTDAGPRRVPEPLWSLYRAAEPLARALERAERFEALARLRELWPDDPALPVESEAYLQDLRVHYASSFSIKLNTLTPERTEFDPVLFSSRAVADADETGQPLDEEGDSILGPSAQRLFATDRFRREREARPVYVLRNGEYIFIDPMLRPALSVVRRLQDAPEEQRRAFILNPRRTLREAVGDDVAERTGLERLFLETDQFSERVAGVDVWRTPVLPWIVPSEKNKWIPEKFGLRVGDDYFAVPAAHLAEVGRRLEEAAEAGRPTADVTGLLEPADENGTPPPDALPVTEQSRAALRSLAPFSEATLSAEGDSEGCDSAEWDAATQGKLFLVVRDNFEEVEFASLGLTEAIDGPLPAVTPPSLLKTSLKPHQIEGLNWLAQNARTGRPGALLADDMGLGKTLQAIAFMAWLQGEAGEGRMRWSRKFGQGAKLIPT